MPVLAQLLEEGLASLPGHRTIVRADGEFGSVGAMRVVADAGAHHLARLSRYTLLDREDVVAAFPGLIWRTVPSAGGGPVREAAELGVFTLHPSEGAAGTGAPVSTRVVVTRFQRDSPPDHGVLRDGYQVEIFATSLPADAWPAGDVAALYFGRGSVENRYAQEDREFALSRTFSQHPPGQEWVVFIAYFLWNLMVCEGAAATAALPAPPPQERRPPDAAVPPDIASSASKTEVAVPDALAHEASVSKTPPPTPEPKPVEEPIAPADAAEAVWRLVRDAIPVRRNWRLDDDACALRCPTGKRHYVFAAYPSTSPHAQRNRVLLRGDAGACDGCPLRAQCSSHRLGAHKQLSVALPEAKAFRVSGLLARARDARPRRSPPRPSTPAAKTRPEACPPAVRVPDRVGPVIKPGPLVPAAPLFLPAAARATVREVLRRPVLDAYIGHAAALRKAGHPLVARDAGERRHARLTWNQRRMRWAADPEVLIIATGSCMAQVRRLLCSLQISRGAKD